MSAVAHRNYFEKGANILIELFDDRLEITNPRALPKGLEEKDLGTKSVLRNPLIASTLLRQITLKNSEQESVGFRQQ